MLDDVSILSSHSWEKVGMHKTVIEIVDERRGFNRADSYDVDEAPKSREVEELLDEADADDEGCD